MNRPIKFKIWDIKEKKWIDPEFYLNLNSIFTCDENYQFCQFTGTVDKTGVEIYEGDIVELDFSQNCIQSFKVIFDRNGSFALADLDDVSNTGLNNTGFCFSRCSAWGKVIGNIFEKSSVQSV